MKRLIAIVLSLSLILCSCGTKTENNKPNTESIAPTSQVEISNNTESVENTITEVQETESHEDHQETTATERSFSGLDDASLLRYVEDNVYSDLEYLFADDNYVIENVNAVYISKEYLEERAYNSQSNIFFGYTVDELDAQFSGTKYVFTLGENGETIVQPLIELEDDTYEKVLKNVAIGTGVILVCVTVSVVTAGVDAPAVSMVFAASAKTATAFALSSGTFSAATAALVTGYQTGDVEEALEAAALAGSESFKWGAISGAVIGGAKEAYALHTAAKAASVADEVVEVSEFVADKIDDVNNVSYVTTNATEVPTPEQAEEIAAKFYKAQQTASVLFEWQGSSLGYSRCH